MATEGFSKYPAREFEKDKYANYLTSWKFPSVFDKVNNDIKDVKKFLKKNRIDRNASDMLDDYIEQIKTNCDEICTNPKKNLSNPRDANRT